MTPTAMKITLAQKVLYNVGSQTAGRVAGLALALFTIRITTSYLGVDGYGDLAIVLALMGLLVSLTDFGITTVLARETAKAPQEADLLGGALFRLRLTTAAGAVCLAIALLPLLPYSHEVKVGLVIGFIGAFFLSVGRFPNAFFQVNLRMDLLAALDVFYKLVSLALVGTVVLLDLGFYALVTALTLAGFIWFASSFLISRRFWSINVRRTSARMQSLVRDSFGVWLVTIVGLLHFQGDMVLLSLLQPPEDVGSMRLPISSSSSHS